MNEKAIQERIKTRSNLPTHVAVIMDGNGRWAKKQGLPRIEGHREGIKSVRAVVEASGELGIKVLTLYTFSTENWNRPKREIAALMRLLLTTAKNEVAELNKNNVRLMTIGNLQDLPWKVRKGVENSIEFLKNNTGLIVNLALSYSSRNELVDAVRKISRDVRSGKVTPDEIDESLFASYLHTANIPDPDLLIRTSGELRVSNFLLWQLAYTEIYVTDVLWPDFRKPEFYQAIEAYQARERRFGLVSEQIRGRK